MSEGLLYATSAYIQAEYKHTTTAMQSNSMLIQQELHFDCCSTPVINPFLFHGEPYCLFKILSLYVRPCIPI